MKHDRHRKRRARRVAPMVGLLRLLVRMANTADERLYALIVETERQRKA